jgi:hypothetical protein
VREREREREIFTHTHTHTHMHCRQAINFLSEEGHIYSTIDDEHFRAIE